ncbi:methylmalonyl-CoA epimerase, mitochondrial-like isoform X2 [Oncorhynchus masou masou]|uniref:methylmalonyl-CoA epimerase, mitochondrial-like isoform X2 n=1 Tax=Oncorhynchus masou masou TaxID=90313 RepID=UPI003183D26E
MCITRKYSPPRKQSLLCYKDPNSRLGLDVASWIDNINIPNNCIYNGNVRGLIEKQYTCTLSHCLDIQSNSLSYVARIFENMAASVLKVARLSKCVRHTCSPMLRTISNSTPLCQGIPGSVWKLGRLNHIAIAVPDMEKATALYRDVLGAQVSDKVPLPEHGVYTVFVELGNTKLELLHPLGEKSPIAGFLQKNKSGGMHHICIEVDDINAAIVDLKARNIRTLSAKPRIGAHGKPVMFLHPKDCDGVLVELEQA